MYTGLNMWKRAHFQKVVASSIKFAYIDTKASNVTPHFSLKNNYFLIRFLFQLMKVNGKLFSFLKLAIENSEKFVHNINLVVGVT